MDALALLHSVLEPGERLLWSGQPKRTVGSSLVALAIPVMMLFGFGNVFKTLLTKQREPLPLYLEMELVAVAGVLVLPFVFYWYRLRQAGITTYAVTNQRLLIAVGPEREKIRTLNIRALARVRMAPSRQGGRALFFSVRGKESVWIFLTSGKADKWRGPIWRVDDPEFLERLIESTRAASAVTAV